MATRPLGTIVSFNALDFAVSSSSTHARTHAQKNNHPTKQERKEKTRKAYNSALHPPLLKTAEF